MRNKQGPPNFNLPRLSSDIRNVLIGAGVLFALELVLKLSQPELVLQLAWHPIGRGFHWYQPLSHYLVQGSSPFSFLLSLLVLYFFLPIILESYKKGKWLPILGSVVLGSWVFGFVTDVSGLLGSTPAWGWTTISTACVALFGLLRPKAVVNLFFILPVQASVFAWGTGVIALLFFLSAPSLETSQHLGSWLGLIAWWFGIGPGSRIRKLKAKAKKIEKDLHRFTVLDGGQSDQNRDDWVN